MSFGGFERGRSPSQPMAEINVTPLVDVVLVLLVMFIITAPLLAYAIRLDLPQVKAPPTMSQGAAIRISIDADGRVFWDGDAVTAADLAARLTAAAERSPPPEVHLRADKATRYERIAEVMAAAQYAGLTKIGFVTEPPAAAKP
ncbi:MAG TPA: biopolymer transporter ExbD [Burkholderiaceae bacterium]|nr:biopolymer transporter ExbD [Burkholderiaceae bacterium]